MIQTPKILTLNLTDKANKLLIDNDYFVYKGSLGKLVNTNNKKYEFKYLLANADFPLNSHEFDIVIIDFINEDTVEYNKSDNTREKNKTENDTYLICQYPQTIFDPRALTAGFFLENLKEIMNKDCIIIIFQNESRDITYRFVQENGNAPIERGEETGNIYKISPYIYFEKNKHGLETKVVIKNDDLANILEKYNNQFSYHNTFFERIIWKGDEKIPDPNFHPLVKNTSDEIVSYSYFTEKTSTFIFPILEDISEFVLEFIQNVGPSVRPTIFPFSSLNKWVDDINYSLPNQAKLLDEKKQILKDFDLKVMEKEEEIVANNQKYSFLHEILTETGDKLVAAIITFLEWLGFENIIDMDNVTNNIKEEDIQIEFNNGLLVVEVKGIGGTSKDSECNQISKIKYRRAKERGKFDVFGLYIVNHQRHLPAKSRKNPPFTQEQIQDAENDERGLLSTWQLFNLYYDIQKGVINKEEAKQKFFEYGLISFTPPGLTFIGTIEEVFAKGEVFILKLNNVEIKNGDTLYIEKNGNLNKLEIIEIRFDNNIVTSINDGEVGIKGNIKVNQKSKVWIQNQ